MPQPIETYTPAGVNKDDSFVAIQRDGSRVYTPGFCFEIVNTRLYGNESGEKGSAKPLRGFEEILIPSLRLVNTKYQEKCIHMVPYDIRNLIILFLYNDNNEHRILRYNILTGEWGTIVQGAILGFKEDTLITDTRVGVLNDYVYWSDFDNEIRQANITEELIDPFEQQISYLKRPPSNQVELRYTSTQIRPERLRDLNIPYSSIAENSYRFAVRFKYKDESFSVFNKPSFLSLAEKEPRFNTRNTITLSFTITEEERMVIKEIQFCYIVNGDPAYYHFLTKKSSEISDLKIDFDFIGQSIIQAIPSIESIKPFEAIPLATRNLIFYKNRVFLTSDRTDLGLDDSQINLDVMPYESSSVPSNHDTDAPIEGFAKAYGKYSYGVALYDANQRYTGVVKTKLWTVSEEREETTVRISGNVDPKFKYYSIFRKINMFQNIYNQIPASLLLFIGTVEEFPTAPSPRSFLLYDRWYFNPTSATPDPIVRSYHLLLPINIRFTPIEGLKVRVIAESGNQESIGVISNYFADANIIEVVGNTFKYPDPTDNSNFTAALTIEMFDTQEIDNSSYYECSRLTRIENGVITERDHLIKVDTYDLDGFVNYLFDYDVSQNLDYFVHGISSMGRASYSPTPTLGYSYGDTPEARVTFTYRGGTVINDRRQAELNYVDVETRVTTVRGYGPDYSKIIEHIGRINTEQDFLKQRNDLPTIQFSDEYVPNSNINNISSFGFGSSYSLSETRGPIIALVRVQEVFVAIHSQFSMSLYIGEGILRTGEDTLLTKVDGVIGDDREHTRSHGTINPESVKVIDGMCFFWDQIEGVVVMYTSGGLVPVSMYKMYTYFKALARKYDPYIDDIKILGTLDVKNREYLLHFPPVGNLPGETWAFNFDYNFWVKYDYIPEATVSIKDQLYSFKNGSLYSHQGRADGKVNFFYGRQKYSRMQFVINPAADKNKKFNNVHIDADVIADTPENVVVRITNDRGQETYMEFQDFVSKNKTYLAPILRDINTSVENGLLPRFDGDDIDSQYILLDVTLNTTKDYKFNNLSVVFNISPYTK